MTEVADNTIVDGRYRVLGRIGSGGMADVYRAEDTHLGREVALKVLHRRFAQDAEFVERFRREAKSAAGLQHPHVVGVFDRGEYEGTYYIAMEHLSGRTLKELVNESAPLEPQRVIDLGIQILQAAGFAHRRGVIHRDFKPHNVIVDDEGVAKVTDFGIARAGASEMTETGSIMGTAQYLSPEQAQGHAVSAASDLYSIGVMLYEMLTGRLPFQGDSAVSIALKHLQEPPPPMSGDGLSVEPNLEAVVMGALAKDPLARWQTAEDFAAALEACRPYVEAHRDGDAPPTQSTAVVAPLPVAETTIPAMGPVLGPPAPEPRERRRSRWPAALLALMVLALVALMAYAFTRPEKVDVPKVTGLDLTKARERLDNAGFENVEVERERSTAELDTVLRQDPDPGEEAAKEDTVTLAVSRGPGEVRVPSVRNLPEQRAFKELEKADLKVTADAQPSNQIKKGFAVGTSPEEGTEVDRGSRVRLFISSGPQKIIVPNVVGLSRESAESRLDREGLGVAVQMQQSDKPEGEVIAQSPREGTRLDPGGRVTLTVSQGIDVERRVSVPDVEGLTEREALSTLRSRGLAPAVRERETDVEEEDGTVLAQRPGPGSQLVPGEVVVIEVGRFEEPEPEATTPTPAPPPGQ